MSRLIRLAVSAVLIITAVAGYASDSSKRVFIIPIEREIDMTAVRQFRSATREAHETGADLIIVRMNTFGGALDAADSIRSGLLRETLPTVAFIDRNAASAGALIALACDSVFMSPGASMGAATVVNSSGEPMPEKYQSYMKTIMRATAEQHGRHICGSDSGAWRRNPDMAAAMVHPDTALAFTASAALEAGFADGITPDIPHVLEQLNMPDAEVTVYESGTAEAILGFLSSAAVRAMLVMFIIGGIYMEMHTPGLGFAAAVAAVATVLYFMPMFASETLPAWVLILFIAGVVLIALEIFVIPGFGITGVTGIIAVAASLAGAAVSSDSVTGFDMASAGNALITVGAGSAMAVALVLYLTSSHGPKFLRRHSELSAELNSSDGFIGVDMSPVEYIGQEAVTQTDMRPSGKIMIGETAFDAVSTGGFIAAGQKVRIVKYENAQLYVCPGNIE